MNSLRASCTSSFPRVTAESTFKDLKIIHWYLNINIMSISSYEGGGLHCHLGIIMTNDEYVDVENGMFPPYPNSGTTATIVAGVTEVHIREAN
jgi:hypothetical protein